MSERRPTPSSVTRAREIVEGWPQTVCEAGKSGLIKDIATAIDAQREADAQIVDSYARKDNQNAVTVCDLAAAAIREGKD